jgi:hypothetical protein
MSVDQLGQCRWHPQVSAIAFLFIGFAPMAARASEAAPATEAAQPLKISLSYVVDAALRCPSEREFRQSVIAQLGYDPFRTTAPHRVVAKLYGSERGTEGSIVWTDANGNKEGGRDLASPTPECVALAEAMSFSIAVQIQLLNASAAKAGNAASTEVARTALPCPAPAPASAPAPAPAPAALLVPSAAVQAPPSSSTYHLSVGVGPTVELGAAPASRAGARFAVAGRAGALSLELAAMGTLSGTRKLQEGRGFSLNLLGLSLATCAHHNGFSLCAVGRVEQLRVQGLGVDDPRSPSSFAWQAGPRLAFQQALAERWFAATHVDGLANLARRTIYLDTVPVWSTPDLLVSAGIDLDFLFP